MDSRIIEASSVFKENANYSFKDYLKLKSTGTADSNSYWCEAAHELTWDKPFETGLSGSFPHIQWFKEGQLNASVNALDRHARTHPNKAALLWEAEPLDANGDPRTVSYTYQELLNAVCKMTALLRKRGLYKGDPVGIYMPMIPDALIAMLACARLGCPHSVVFGGFKSEALMERMVDLKAKALITADFGYRRGERIQLLSEVRKQLSTDHSLRFILSFEREKNTKSNQYNSFILNATNELQNITQQEISRLSYPASLDSEHPLFVLYTSGTTGKPKGLVHTTGGYLTGVLRSMKYVFDIKPKDIFFCTADIGWITGHSYVTYGPLLAGATLLMYEGAPTYPTASRLWDVIDRAKATHLYTAPTAIRAFMKLGEESFQNNSLTSLRLLGSVGEPINPEAWMWYYKNIGKERCPVVDTYWQTETGSIVIAPHPAWTPMRPGSATEPLPGYDIAIVNRANTKVSLGEKGKLTIQRPWPSMARTILNDSDRFSSTYFSEVKGAYFSGDGAVEKPLGAIWCLGRMDDVLNVSGHRLGTMEIESACVAHPSVAEAAAVGKPDDVKGQAITVFVTLRNSSGASENLKHEIKLKVAEMIGPFARPDEIRFTQSLPKTRSGKIMRRLLREIAAHGSVRGDLSTLEDLSVVASLSLKEDEET